MRQFVTRTAERMITALGGARLLRWIHRRDTLVLALHNIVPDDHPGIGERVLHLPQGVFAQLLDDLAVTHEIISLDALDRSSRGKRPRLAITFDDAYSGAATLGAAVLAARGLPATVFVAPGILGCTGCWWDALAGPDGLVPDKFRHRALSDLRGDAEAILKTATHRPHPLPPAYHIASEAVLYNLSRQDGITFGAHSWHHLNLATLDGETLRFELEAPLAWLRERYSCTRPWIVYPYGQTSPGVEAEAAAAGYQLGFRADYGWLPSEPAGRFDLRRYTVGFGSSREALQIRCAGLPPR